MYVGMIGDLNYLLLLVGSCIIHLRRNKRNTHEDEFFFGEVGYWPRPYGCMKCLHFEYVSSLGCWEAFNKIALSRFGSGWAWLGVAPDGQLKVTSTANQD